MRLPPLNALRAFEVAARHLSVQKAAQELFVTPAAVSQQIKALEQRLGVSLFRRLPRRLELTETGAALMQRLSAAFREIEDAVQQVEIKKSDARGRLVIGAPPGFGSSWLLHRLADFQTHRPDIELQLAARPTMSDPVRRASDDPDDLFEGCDVAIRFGDGHYPGCVVHKLFSLHSTPMCHPALIDGRHPLREPRDLADHTLLHIRNDVPQMDVGWPGWRDWFKAAGVPDLDYRRGPVFNQVALAIEAAADRMGVVLGVPLLAARELSRGRLAIPFPISLTMSAAYYVVHPQQAADEVITFRDWLIGEAAREKWARPLGGLEPLRWIP
ncbi:transcriptional regulator GcvA [Sinimarinibacterium thermocellulolyticum]|uniref:Transcriptional regulator GcvA n=1 Tax=Sinimarinibacterium thermocellulolyticum TaxID=3170016 RepID=A0ABV2AA15_9GAMM